MNLNIRITGPAGTGVNSTVDIVSHIFAQLGYDIITDIEYESRIKGGINYFDVFISDSQEHYLTKKVDILVAFNAQSCQAQLESLKDNATLIINSKWVKKLSLPEEKNISILDLEITDKYDNTYLLGVLGKFLQIDPDIICDKLKDVFAKKGESVILKNIETIQEIYQRQDIEGKSDHKITKVGESKNISYGNKSLASGAIAADLEYYSAYPMTPASTILTEIIQSKQVKYLQAEDEIAVINSALGASFTGARSMAGTSGGGFALMTEALSFAVQAEFPITVVLSQRAGPSTGTPTYQEQGDIHFALNPTFGDFEHVVLYPSSIEEAYSYGALSLNIADTYQIPVILLMDKQSSEMHVSYESFPKVEVNRGEILEHPPEDYKRYELTESGISPRVKVGTKNGDFIATSYEHDEYGATSEDSENKKLFTEKRFKKLRDFFQQQGIKGYEIIDPHAKKMLVTYSFTSYTAKQFIKQNPGYGLIIIKFLKPLDNSLREEIIQNNYEELIFVESNYSGQVENYLCKEFGLHFINNLKISNMRKYDLMPFYIEDFNELLRK